ncbi:unnamed protein product [Scytosiphon promiscuus]
MAQTICSRAIRLHPGSIDWSFQCWQVIERMDIQAAMATLDDDTITSDQVKDLFTGLGEKAKASATRVSALPSSQQNIADLEACKERLQAKLKHLRSTTDVLGNLKAADNAS